MRYRNLAALLVLAFLVSSLAVPLAQAQYTQGLPPGILNVEVDGQPIDSVTVPLTNRATPEISGRVDLGVASIELAIADGEVVRFLADLDDRGRFRVPVPQALSDGQYSLYIGDVLVGAFAIQGAVPEEREPGKLLDIARVVPYPADFAGTLPGIGFLDGRFFTIEEEALRTATGGDGASAEELRQTQRSLVEAGWLQRYENRLASPNPDDPAAFDIQVSSFVVEYASGADARTAFAAVVGDEAGVDFTTIGNESVLTLVSGTTPDTGADYQAARLVFRLGPMLGLIISANLRNEQPDLALLGSVAQMVAARGVAIADRQTLPLGGMTLRLDSTNAVGALVRRDLYEVRGGQVTAVYSQDDADEASRISAFSGTTDVFSSTTSGTFTSNGQGRRESRANRSGAPEPGATTGSSEPTPSPVISIEGDASPAGGPTTPTAVEPTDPSGSRAPEESATAQVYMNSALYEFPGESEADAWFVMQRDQLIADGQSRGAAYRAVEDAPALGDSSAFFSSARPVGTSDQAVNGFRLYARSGQIVAVIELGSVPDLPVRAASAIMEQQLACISAQLCAGPASLPGSLFGPREESAGDGAANGPRVATTFANQGTVTR